MTIEGLAHCLVNRGCAYYEEGLKEKACLDWSRALELGDKNILDNIKKYCVD